ncbi:MAG: bifunctional riboflavin kinase/FAD synthetase [Anaerolineales bacterium]|nr:bifunctional riboflavin kinase/FAD synthetase [Anaerolineales bacterium]
MQHVTAFEDLRLDHPAYLTIGAFDGVHRGHQALIGAMVTEAHGAGCPAVVLTFLPHPSVVLRGRRLSFYLSTPEEKAEYLSALGVDALVTHPFNTDVAAIQAGDFLERLVAYTRLRVLWCGKDFALGHNREGNVEYLSGAGARLGFEVRVQTPVLIDGEIISSTRIRQTLRDGAVEQAARYLGRPFRVTGEVVEGAKRGRQLGIPTANVAVGDERATPAVGVYACRASHAGWRGPAVVNIGFRPTFEAVEPHPVIEAHLLDFSGDLYGQRLSLDFFHRLRPEMKFSGIDALLAQIKQDIAQARTLLA